MKDRLKNTKKHLQTQIKAAKQMDSKFVYILVSEAERCLELAEVEDTIGSMSAVSVMELLTVGIHTANTVEGR